MGPGTEGERRLRLLHSLQLSISWHLEKEIEMVNTNLKTEFVQTLTITLHSKAGVISTVFMLHWMYRVSSINNLLVELCCLLHCD